jgi:septum formation protein
MEAIILASGSAARRAMLVSAGVAIEVDRPGVDEAAIKAGSRSRGMTVEETAQALALAKANDVSPRWPGRLVLAADQMLDCEGDWFDKPADRAAAARQLVRLSGRTHRLISSAVLSRDGTIVKRRLYR